MSSVDAPVSSLTMNDIAEPSTLIPSAPSSHPQQQRQPLRNDKPLLDMLYPIAFSILWLFGLARNLLSYIVSLGIIPLKTASGLFGFNAQQSALRVRSDRKGQPGSQFTSIRVEHPTESKRTRSKNRERRDSITNSWTTHKSAQSASAVSNSSADTLHTNSLPSTPKNRNKVLTEPSTDTEQLLRRSRPREGNERHSPRQTTLTHRALIDADVTDVESSATEKRFNKGRSRIDHATRRILFVDSKASRRQTAPATSSHVDSPSVISVPTSPVALSESPKVELSSLPKGVDGSEPAPSSLTSHSQTVSSQDTRASGIAHPNSSDEFGKRTTTPRVSVDVDRHAVSGAESTGENKMEKRRGRLGGNIKLFSRKRSNSVASPSTDVSLPAAAPVPPPMTMPIPQTPSRLRRKSPFPARPSRTSKDGGVSASDAEMSSSAAVGSVSWLRSRPKKLTKTSRSRSNSMSTSKSPSPMPTQEPPTASMVADSPSVMHYRSGSEQPQSANSDLNFANPPNTAIPSPRYHLPRTPTQNSVVSNCSTSSSNKSPSTSRSRFNPIRNLEAHLYNRHGVGTGPDVFDFVATPIPKTGIKRTNPYELMGVGRPVTSPSSATQTPTSPPIREDDQQKHLDASPVIPRRSSAPAGSVSPPKLSKSDKRLTRPSSPPRAYTEPK